MYYYDDYPVPGPLPYCGTNTLRPRQDGRHFTDDSFKCIFLNEIIWILLKSSLKFVSKGRINNIPALVQIVAWRRAGDKPLSEAMMVSLPKHICVTRPEWVNTTSKAMLVMQISHMLSLLPFWQWLVHISRQLYQLVVYFIWKYFDIHVNLSISLKWWTSEHRPRYCKPG